MTAIDIAVQSKRLGADEVHIVYRRGPVQMGASAYEQHLAQTSGVTIHHWAQPVNLIGDGHVHEDRLGDTQVVGTRHEDGGQVLVRAIDDVKEKEEMRVSFSKGEFSCVVQNVDREKSIESRFANSVKTNRS